MSRAGQGSQHASMRASTAVMHDDENLEALNDHDDPVTRRRTPMSTADAIRSTAPILASFASGPSRDTQPAEPEHRPDEPTKPGPPEEIPTTEPKHFPIHPEIPTQPIHEPMPERPIAHSCGTFGRLIG